MRLTCPNCNAQYEVDAAVIPDLGRDVQCSNCGQTWFQPGALTPDAAPDAPQPVSGPSDAEPFDGWHDEKGAEVEGATAPSEAPPLPDPTDTADDEAAPDAPTLPEATSPAPPHDEADDGADDFAPHRPTADTFDEEFDEDYEAPTAVAPQRKAMDNDLLAVLREEAEREVQARKAEGSALETQPDLGLAVPKSEPRPQEREARTDSFDEMHDEPPTAAALRATRRDLLPDIEEINSTLRATSDRSQAQDMSDPALERSQKTGFGIGFGGVIALAAIGVAVYIGAPKLATASPALAPVLERYVDGVDGARVWLDRTMSGLTQSMRDSSTN